MFRLCVRGGRESGEATVLIAGDAVFTHAGELQSALSQVLADCEHLTIDIGKVELLDLTFRVLLCSLHRQSELAHKKITLQGADCRRDVSHCFSGSRVCLVKDGNGSCHLWDPGADGRGGAAGNDN
jgi:ABC-type transporter Mla MlaB component